jgi:MYXO-CTERM domain-containing protein
MKSVFLTLAAATLFGLAPPAHADPYTYATYTYTITGDGTELYGSITRTVQIDTGGVGAADTTIALTGSLFYDNGAYEFNSATPNNFDFDPSGLPRDFIEFVDGSEVLNLAIQTSLSADSYSLPLCSLANPCAGNFGPFYSYFTPDGSNYFNISDGTLTAADVSASPTPGPSSIALLGTGLLGLAFVARRRILRT